ncbi:MAG: FAD:protein FMN transferase [Mobilitalea sp.]
MERLFYAFGTMNHIQVEDNISIVLMDQMVETASELDDLLSVFKPNSEISQINENAGLRPTKVSSETIKLLERALHYSDISKGSFDITIRPAVKLWSIGHKEQRIPTEEEIQEIRQLVDYRQVEIDKVSGSVYLRNKGQAIDLGGIAKGYAADLIGTKLKMAGVKSAILNFGGTIVTIGNKKNGTSWRVGIQNPLAKRGCSVGAVNLKDTAMVTSAVNERFFIKDGIRYHHLLDPTTLKPAQSGVMSISAVGTCAMDLDALTTALFVMGMEKGIALAKSLGIDAIYLLDNGSMFSTNGFVGKDLSFQTNS